VFLFIFIFKKIWVWNFAQMWKTNMKKEYSITMSLFFEKKFISFPKIWKSCYNFPYWFGLVEKNMGNECNTYKKFKWHGWNLPNDLNYTYKWNWSNNYIHVWQWPSSIWFNITHMTNNIHELNFMIPSLLCLIAFVWSISFGYYVSLISSTQSCFLYVMNICHVSNIHIAKLCLCAPI
jgi:hypothetical protein